MRMARTLSHCVLHGFLRMQAIHSAKEISSTSGRRRSTVLRRSLQPDGGPRSSPRRSSPERLFLEYFIPSPVCYLNGRDANLSLHHSLFQVSAHSLEETVKDFTVHKKCCRKHPRRREVRVGIAQLHAAQSGTPGHHLTARCSVRNRHRGQSFQAAPLPHHPACGSAPGGSRS